MLALEPAPAHCQSRWHRPRWRVPERLCLRAVAVQAAQDRSAVWASGHPPVPSASIKHSSLLSCRRSARSSSEPGRSFNGFPTVNPVADPAVCWTRSVPMRSRGPEFLGKVWVGCRAGSVRGPAADAVRVEPAGVGARSDHQAVSARIARSPKWRSNRPDPRLLRGA